MEDWPHMMYPLSNVLVEFLVGMDGSGTEKFQINLKHFGRIKMLLFPIFDIIFYVHADTRYHQIGLVLL